MPNPSDSTGLGLSLLEYVNAGVVVHGPDGKVLSANEHACRLLGLPLDQIMGAGPDDPRVQHLREDGTPLPPDEHPVSRVLATHQPVLDMVVGLDRSKTGDQIWMHAGALPELTDEGELRRVVVTLVDITKRREAEEGLRESEQRFRTLIDGAPDGIFLESGDRFQFVNAALVRLLGAAGPDDLVGTEVAARLSPEGQERVRVHRQTLQGRALELPPTNFDFVRLDGSQVPVETSAVTFPVHDEMVYLVFVRDRSERETAEAERAQLQAELENARRLESVGKLAGGVAHDFNNILMVQKGYCELMRMSLREGDPMAASLAQIEAHADRGAELTRQLLAFSRKQTLQPEVIDLNSLLGEMEGMLRRLVGEGVDLATVLSPHPATVKVDRSQFEQVLVNLAANARDSMPRGGTLTFEMSWVDVEEPQAERDLGLACGPYVKLSVRDTGRGMDEEAARRVFEPFFGRKKLAEGADLGLSTVYGIVRQSGGDIRVWSELGKGTAFDLYLPRVEAELPQAAAPRGSRPEGEQDLILVVEDEPALRGLVVMMTEKMGYRASEAANAGEAILLVEEKQIKPALVLTDVVMPGMTGDALVQRLRAKLPDAKVIYMSGYTDDGILQDQIGRPGVAFLRKPFSITELESTIRSLMGPPRP